MAEYLKLDEKVAHSQKDVANLFAEHFKSVYTLDEDTPTQHTPISSSTDHWSKLHISMNTILEKLKSLITDKAKGPDELPPIFFKRCANAITFPLFIIFNEPLAKGFFPSLWKIAHVRPIHKSGSTHDVKNYRPI